MSDPCFVSEIKEQKSKHVIAKESGTPASLLVFISNSRSFFDQKQIMKILILITYTALDRSKRALCFQGHPTDRFGKYLFGRPKIASDIRIYYSTNCHYAHIW